MIALILAAAVLATPAPTPVEITKEQADRLLSAQAQVNQASREVIQAKTVEEATQQRFQAVLAKVALELHLNLDTHELDLAEAGPGRYAFKVKATPTPTPRPTP